VKSRTPAPSPAASAIPNRQRRHSRSQQTPRHRQTWLAEGLERRAWKPATVRVYGNVLDHLEAAFGPLPLGSIRPRDVAAYRRDALDRLAPRTVALHLTVLHDMLKTAVREDLIESNPAASAERPKLPRNRWRILEPNEVPRVSKAFTDARRAGCS
jgi:site-specific recombinase XerD